MDILENNKNIVNKGAEEISVAKVDLDYFANYMGVINKIDKHSYDIHLNNIPFEKYLDKKVDTALFRQTLKARKIFTLDKVYDIHIIDHMNNGITIESPYSNDGTELQKTKYRDFDKIIFACNQFLADEERKECQCKDMWVKEYNHNNRSYDENIIKNKTRFTRLFKLERDINKFINDIKKEVKREQKEPPKRKKPSEGTRRRLLKSINKKTKYRISKLYQNALQNRLSKKILKQETKEEKQEKIREEKRKQNNITRLHEQLHSTYKFMNKELTYKSNAKADFNFGEGLFAKIGFNYNEILDKDRCKDYDYLMHMAVCYVRYLNIFKNFLHSTLAFMKWKDVRTVNDGFNVDVHELKTYILNNAKDIFNSYENTNTYNLYAFYDYYIMFIKYKMNKIIEDYIAEQIGKERLLQYGPLPVLLSFFVLSLSLTMSYNFTLLKEIGERNNLALIYSCIMIFASLIMLNVVRNSLRKKKYRNTESKHIAKVCAVRKNTSIASLAIYILVTIILFSLNIFYIFRYDGYDDNFYYIDGEGDSIIIDGLRNDEQTYYTVPKTIDGRDIENISSLVFQNNESIQYVDLSRYKGRLIEGCFEDADRLQYVKYPSDMEIIPQNCFRGCRNLIEINGIENINEIGNYAFRNCNKLTISNLPSKLKTIGIDAFKSCSNIMEIYFPDSIENVGKGAFDNCPIIRKVHIHNLNSFGNLSEVFGKSKESIYQIDIDLANNIYDNAFNGFSHLQDLTLDSDVSNIGNYAFNDCKMLENLAINTTAVKIGKGSFKNCKNLETYDFFDSIMENIPEEAFQNSGIHGDLVFNESIKNIGANAFCDTNISSILLSNSIESIDDNAFDSCNLSSLIIPKPIEIGSNAFANNNISELSFHYNGDDKSLGYTFGKNKNKIKRISYIGAESICDNMFEDCQELEELILTVNPTSIGKSAFKNCSKMNHIDRFGQLSVVADECFANCSAIYNVNKQFPDITKIGNKAFANCNGLINLTIPNNVTSIESCAFQNCTNINNIFLNEKLQSVGTDAFDGCRKSGKLGLFDSIENVGNLLDNSAFVELSLVVNKGDKTIRDLLNTNTATFDLVYCDYNVDFIADGMFMDLTNAKQIILSNSNILSIGANAFNNCKQLMKLEINTSGLTIGEGAFGGCTQIKNIPFDSWIKDKIPNDAFKECLNLTTFAINPSVKTIGSRAFEKSMIQNINLRNVESIGESAFKETHITNIELNDNLTEIPNDAFANCYNMTINNFPSKLTKIGNRAFANCNAITKVVLGSSIQNIASDAFNNCLHLNEMEIYDIDTIKNLNDIIGDAITNIEKCTIQNANVISENYFNGLVNLKEVHIKGNITEIKDYAFKNCENLSVLEMHSDNLTIGKGAFYNCLKLTTLEALNSIDVIPEYAFFNCGAIHDIHTQFGNLTHIGDYAFANCALSSKLILPSSLIDIGENAFKNCFNINSIELYDTIENSSNLSSYLFTRDVVVHVVNGNKTIKNLLGDVESIEKISLKGYFNNIIDDMFLDCKKVLTIDLDGNNIDTIGKCAFKNCSSLNNIICKYSTLNIGEESFMHCSNLNDYSFIGNIVDEIPDGAFNYCAINEQISLNSQVTRIGDNAFSFNNLNNIIIDENIIEIGEEAFAYNVITEIYLPESLQSIGHKAFDENVINTIGLYNVDDECTMENLLGYSTSFVKNIYYNGNSIPNRMFCDCISLEALNINGAIESIGDEAFLNCNEFVMTADLEGVKSIGNKAFYGTSIINDISVQFPIVESIGKQAFSQCTDMNATLAIPATVNTIGDNAFYGTNSIEILKLEHAVANLSASAFNGMNGIKQFVTNSNVSGLNKLPSEIFANLEFVNLSTDKTMNKMLGNNIKNIEKLKMISNSDVIIDNMFKGCSQLQSIKYNEKINKIGAHSFEGCSKLYDIDLIDNAKEIGDYAFNGCSTLSYVVFSSQLKSIGEGAFANCQYLNKINLPQSLKYIGAQAFANTALENVALPYNVEYIGKNAFDSDTEITNKTTQYQSNLYAWDFNWDGQGDIQRLFGKIGYWAQTKPILFYSILGGIVLVITAIIITLVIIIKKKARG